MIKAPYMDMNGYMYYPHPMSFVRHGQVMYHRDYSRLYRIDEMDNSLYYESEVFESQEEVSLFISALCKECNAEEEDAWFFFDKYTQDCVEWENLAVITDMVKNLLKDGAKKTNTMFLSPLC